MLSSVFLTKTFEGRGSSLIVVRWLFIVYRCWFVGKKIETALF